MKVKCVLDSMIASIIYQIYGDFVKEGKFPSLFNFTGAFDHFILPSAFSPFHAGAAYILFRK